MLKVMIAGILVLAAATVALGEAASTEAESRVLVKRYVKDYGIIHKIEMDSEGLFVGEGVPERYVLSTGEKRRRSNLTLQSIADDLSLRAHYRELTYWASSCANPQKPGAPVEDLRAPLAGDVVIIYFEKYEGGATALVVCFAGKECWLPEVGMEGRPDWFVKDAKRFAGVEVELPKTVVDGRVVLVGRALWGSGVVENIRSLNITVTTDWSKVMGYRIYFADGSTVDVNVDEIDLPARGAHVYVYYEAWGDTEAKQFTSMNYVLSDVELTCYRVVDFDSFQRTPQTDDPHDSIRSWDMERNLAGYLAEKAKAFAPGMP